LFGVISKMISPFVCCLEWRCNANPIFLLPQQARNYCWIFRIFTETVINNRRRCGWDL